ncbi:MAG: SUMF1/EgtB/PvdO family nonheme iron enzyme [Nitrospirae bacterium]|nr:SUMF1/EgtB/PvdO family nonheme iron enzyme [Nitrospirota bacterium]
MTLRDACLLALATLTLSGCAHLPVTHKAAGVSPGMVLIPAGPFTMGTDQTDATSDVADYGLPFTLFDDANPAHAVDLPAFYIDRYEMTNAEYLQFLDVTEIPQSAPATWEDNHYPEGMGDYPVTGLNWYQATFACMHFGKRLPTEAEWEKAARGADGRTYPWGNGFEEAKANISRGEHGRLMPVGSFPQGASPYGVEDMIGNAWEWTSSYYRAYPGSAYASDKFTQLLKVIRGNSYGDHGHFPDPEARRAVVGQMSRANYRFYFPPTAATRDSGVRCAMAAEPAP